MDWDETNLEREFLVLVHLKLQFRRHDKGFVSLESFELGLLNCLN